MKTPVVANGCRKQKPSKPEKPYPDFPLTAHASGKWCKKVRGKIHYFGTWADPNAALQEWLAEEPNLRANGEKSSDNTEADIKWLLNPFLDAKVRQRRLRQVANSDDRLP